MLRVTVLESAYRPYTIRIIVTEIYPTQPFLTDNSSLAAGKQGQLVTDPVFISLACQDYKTTMFGCQITERGKEAIQTDHLDHKRRKHEGKLLVNTSSRPTRVCVPHCENTGVSSPLPPHNSLPSASRELLLS